MKPWYHKILNYYHQTTLSNLVVDILLSTCLEETLDSLPSDTSIGRILSTTVRPYDPCNNAEAQLTFLVRLEKICDLLSLASRVRYRVVGPYARKQESSSTVPCWNLEHD